MLIVKTSIAFKFPVARAQKRKKTPESLPITTCYNPETVTDN